MNRGLYLERGLLDAEPSDFCVGVAGYPEKHFEAPNLDVDLRHARAKVEAGAAYIVTQMFFENSHYFRYVERARAAGIEVPVVPGLKVLTTKSQTQSLPRTFHCDVPIELADEVERAPASQVADIGVEWATRQARELLERGAPSIHFYVLSNAEMVGKVVEKLGL
jgi:methylenetetrahydrofolate reductase (NADPH)